MRQYKYSSKLYIFLIITGMACIVLGTAVIAVFGFSESFWFIFGLGMLLCMYGIAAYFISAVSLSRKIEAASDGGEYTGKVITAERCEKIEIEGKTPLDLDIEYTNDAGKTYTVKKVRYWGDADISSGSEIPIKVHPKKPAICIVDTEKI